MKHLILSGLLIVCSFHLVAQNEEALKKIETAKIAIITKRLDLTPEQAQQFWPIYNEMFDKQRALRKEFQEMRRSIDLKTASEEESKRLLEFGLDVKENHIKIEREYSERLSTVVSSRQMMNLRQAEEDFRQILIERVKERKLAEETIRQNRLNNAERLKNRRND